MADANGAEGSPSVSSRPGDLDAEAAVLTRISQGTIDAGSVAAVCRVTVESLRTVEAIARVGPRRAYLTHMNHDLGHAATNARLPAGIELAYDGLVLDVAVDVE